MEGHGVHGMDAQALQGLCVFICLHTLSPVACSMKSYPGSQGQPLRLQPSCLCRSCVCAPWVAPDLTSFVVVAVRIGFRADMLEDATGDEATDPVTCEDASE